MKTISMTMKKLKISQYVTRNNIAISISIIAVSLSILGYYSNKESENRDLEVEASATHYEFMSMLGINVTGVGFEGEKLAEKRMLRGESAEIGDEELMGALPLIDKYAALKPDDTDTIAWMRFVYALSSEDIDQAIELLESFGDGRPYFDDIKFDENLSSRVQAYVFGSMIAANRSKPETAREYMGKALSEAPNSPVVLTFYSSFLHSIGENDASIEMIEKAITLDPANPAHYSLLGHIYAESNRIDMAESVLRHAVSLERKSATAFNGLAIVLAHQGKHEEAVEYYRKSLALEPDNSNTHSNLEISLRNLGRSAEAELAAEKAELYSK